MIYTYDCTDRYCRARHELIRSIANRDAPVTCEAGHPMKRLGVETGFRGIVPGGTKTVDYAREADRNWDKAQKVQMAQQIDQAMS